MSYKTDYVAKFADKATSLGFTVYMAESGTYGFFSDDTENRVVSFQCDFASIRFSGNYAASRRSGTGWEIGEISHIDSIRKETLAHMLTASAPRWTQNENPQYTTVADQLKCYGKSSKYRKWEPGNEESAPAA